MMITVNYWIFFLLTVWSPPKHGTPWPTCDNPVLRLVQYLVNKPSRKRWKFLSDSILVTAELIFDFSAFSTQDSGRTRCVRLHAYFSAVISIRQMKQIIVAWTVGHFYFLPWLFNQ